MDINNIESSFPNNFFFQRYISLIKTLIENVEVEGYVEKHHIFPTAVFGKKSNETVTVSYHHHIILHYLLYRGFSVAKEKAAEASMAYATRRMLGNGQNDYNGTHADEKVMRLAYKSLSFIK